jgi:hypothetical protein
MPGRRSATHTAAAPLILSLLLAVAPRPTLAQGFTGEYVMFHEGTEVMALRMEPGSGGQVSGELSFPALALPFSGRVAEGVLRFTTTIEGEVQRWEARPAGDALRVTMSAAGRAPETHTLARRGAGWSADSPLAREWEGRLAGRVIQITERTGGGTSGGAIKNTFISFCPGSKALLEEHFALNVSVPGMGGGQTSRRTVAGWWRVLTSGGHAGVEFSSDGSEIFQLGVRAGSEASILLVAGQPIRLSAAGDRCSNPSLAGLPARRSAPSAPAAAAPGGYAAMVPRVRDGAADGFAGTYTGRTWMGPVVVEVRREGDGYQVVMNPDAPAPKRGSARPDEQGGISGELANRVLGMESRDTFWLRPDPEGFRFRTRGIDVVVQRH